MNQMITHLSWNKTLAEYFKKNNLKIKPQRKDTTIKKIKIHSLEIIHKYLCSYLKKILRKKLNLTNKNII